MKHHVIYHDTHCEIVISYKGDEYKTLVSRKSLPLIRNHKWNIWLKNNYGKIYHYVATKVTDGGKQKTLYMHHLINGFPKKGMVTDHINRNSLDNRLENLRIVDRRANLFNSEKYAL